MRTAAPSTGSGQALGSLKRNFEGYEDAEAPKWTFPLLRILVTGTKPE